VGRYGRRYAAQASCAGLAAISWGAIALPRSHHGEPWLGWVIAALAGATVFSLCKSLRTWFGLIERAFYVAMSAWPFLVSARVL
jgi:hypothetical protein